jgi:PKD repeat protein
MKRTFLLLLLVFSGTAICLPQTADSGYVDPKPSCGAFFGYTFNDSIKTFVEAYPYRFIDQSMGNVYEWKWDFGDGVTSDERNPMHFYSHAWDTVLICLTIKTVDSCTSSYCQRLIVSQPQVPPDTDYVCKAFWQAYSDMLMDPAGRMIVFDSSYSPLARNYFFQDLSSGQVIKWNWQFGDGSSSTEQSPVHQYKQDGVYTVCLDIATGNNCTSSFCDSLWVGVQRACSLTGTVMDYTGLDGCGLLIILDNGEALQPAEVVPNFVLKDGQRVRLSYTELTDRAGICMKGKLVRIDCIEEITADYCQASFSYYPIPWISSYPPIYQFVDQSQGNVMSKTWDFGDGTVTNEYGPAHRYQYSGLYTVCLTIYTSDGCSGTSCETAYFEGANPQPGLCDNLIRLTTEIVLNGQTCNGSATADLVNKAGDPVYGETYYWSTGETGPSINNLCTGTNYSVIVIDSSGCAVSGSFSFGGNVFLPDTLIGFWNFEQYDKSFIFNIPVFSDSIRCVWDFGDGDTAAGNSVTHTYEAENNYNVALRIFDHAGNLIFTQQIPVSAGSPTGIKNKEMKEPEVYPVPAGNTLYIRQVELNSDLTGVEVINSNGQVLGHYSFSKATSDRTVEIDVSSLSPGFYLGRLIYRDGTQNKFRFVK